MREFHLGLPTLPYVPLCSDLSSCLSRAEDVPIEMLRQRSSDWMDWTGRENGQKCKTFAKRSAGRGYRPVELVMGAASRPHAKGYGDRGLGDLPEQQVQPRPALRLGSQSTAWNASP